MTHALNVPSPETKWPTSGCFLPASGTQWIALGACVAAETYFLLFFNESQFQPTVDLSWLIAVACWTVAFWRSDVPVLPRLRHPYWFYALYAAALLPFCTNWRWAMTADSPGWVVGGISLAERGPPFSVLNLHGVIQFGYLQMALHDIFMLLVKPTLFWHRAGQISVGVLSIAAVYSVFARLVSPNFGLLVGACSLLTSVMLVHTYCSYPLLDAVASGWAVVAVGLWVHRQPDSQKAWLVLGLLTGFLAFLTPNSWAMAMCVWGWLVVQVPFRRWRPSLVLVALGAVLVVSLPVLHQIARGQGAELFSQVEHPQWTAQKLFRFFREAATISFDSNLQSAGAFGPQLPPGFRWLVVPGILVAILFGRRFPGSRLVAGFYLLNLVLLTLTQGPYHNVSVKRALVLIPMSTYFVFLPFHRYLRSLAVVLPLIMLWASFGVYDVVARMQPGRTGYNLFDGVIEAHQRFSDAATVCVVVSKDQFAENFLPGSDIDRMYGLSPHIRHVHDPTDPACREVMCYSPEIDQLDLKALGMEEIPMLGSVQLRCGRRPTGP